MTSTRGLLIFKYWQYVLLIVTFRVQGASLGVDGAQVGIFQQTNQIRFSDFLNSLNSISSELQVCFVVLGDFSDQTLERTASDQQFSWFLISTDLSQRHGTCIGKLLFTMNIQRVNKVIKSSRLNFTSNINSNFRSIIIFSHWKFSNNKSELLSYQVYICEAFWCHPLALHALAPKQGRFEWVQSRASCAGQDLR